MMARRIALSAGDCQRFATIVESLGVTQKSISLAADVKQPWLSYLLRGHRVTNVDSVPLQLLATHLTGLLQRAREKKTLPDEEIRLALHFLSRFGPTSANPPAERHSPGGPVPTTAIPYVNREHDARLQHVSGQTGGFDVLVWGPAQSGKSTALALLERRAHQVGIETAWFDPQPFVGKPPESIDDDALLDARVAMDLSELLQAQWGLAKPRSGSVDSIAKLNAWLPDELAVKGPSAHLLILDDLANLGPGAVARWTSQFLRLAGAWRARRDIRLSIAVGATHQFATSFSSHFRLVSNLYWTLRVDVPWFTEAEVRRMTDLLREPQPPGRSSVHSTLHSLFNGQPYLTHAAANDSGFLDAVQTWLSDPSDTNAGRLRALPPYRRHLAATRFAMFGPTYQPTTDEAVHLRDSFVTACHAVRSKSKRKAPDFNPNHLDFLNRARLLNAAGTPALPIYSLLADDLRGTPSD